MTQSKLVNATRQYDSLTANGAVTHSTSLSNCLDLFFIAGASRRMSEDDIIMMFNRARSEDKLIAYLILFWARDCRGGAGEKRFFRTIAKYCNTHLKDEWDGLWSLTPEYGSWKDVFEVETPSSDMLQILFEAMYHYKDNLLAKWYPRKGPWFNKMLSLQDMSAKDFRKMLVNLTNVVETQLCQGQWDAVEYSKVPSVAMNKYRHAFGKHDGERFAKFNQDVLDGKAKVNASVLFPHQLYQAIDRGDDVTAVEAQWQSLPNYMEGSKERILPVCDVSGSMQGLPMDVSVSLGLYISERNEGIFKDAVMTFSERPQMHYVQGSNLRERMYNLQRADWGYNTNLQATFDLVLNSAVRESIPQEEMPTKLLIISDMEFDGAVEGGTNLDAIKEKYSEAGYEMPQIIFWNVNGRVGNSPANKHDKGIGLVSGFSPSILKTILQGEVVTPEQLMLDALGSDRYAPVRKEFEEWVA